MDATIPILLGGLGLFIYAISQLSSAMNGIFSEGAKQSIEKYTGNIFLSILIGTVTTILLGSSSAVIILTIVFINAKTLNFRQAMGIIMGANIGTTFSSQLIAIDVGKYSIFPLLIGLALMIFSKGERIKRIGKVMLYLGLLFFGLFLIEESVLPLRDSETFRNWISRIENHTFQGAMIGGLVTLIIQSSSATVGIAIVLSKQQMINIAGGIAVMLGAELGTCSDTLIATINGSRQALKAGLFHLIFNILSISLGLLLFQPFVQLVEYISAGQSIESHIANAHVIFNVGGVLIFLPFVKWFENGLNTLLPDKPST